MKPFLGTDTAVRGNTALDGEEFIVRKPSEAMAPIIEKYSNETADAIDKQVTAIKKRLPLMLLTYLCLYSPLFAVAATLGALGESLTLAQALSNGRPIYIATLIAFVLGIVLRHREKLREAAEEAEEQKNESNNGDEIYAQVMADMGVPTDAKDLEVLFFDYKVKDGEYINKCKSDSGAPSFYNGTFSAYSDADNLYLADMDGVYAFSRSELVALHTVEKKCELTMWLKDKDIKDEEFSEFRLKEDSEGDVHCNCYHILKLNHNSESWGIYFPSYEIRALEDWCGLKAE